VRIWAYDYHGAGVGRLADGILVEKPLRGHQDSALPWLDSGQSSPVDLTGSGCEVCLKIDRTVEIAAFCRELGDNVLQNMAREQNMESVYKRAEEFLKASRVGPELARLRLRPSRFGVPQV
jgi:hypothetical protein